MSQIEEGYDVNQPSYQYAQTFFEQPSNTHFSNPGPRTRTTSHHVPYGGFNIDGGYGKKYKTHASSPYEQSSGCHKCGNYIDHPDFCPQCGPINTFPHQQHRPSSRICHHGPNCRDPECLFLIVTESDADNTPRHEHNIPHPTPAHEHNIPHPTPAHEHNIPQPPTDVPVKDTVIWKFKDLSENVAIVMSTLNERLQKNEGRHIISELKIDTFEMAGPKFELIFKVEIATRTQSSSLRIFDTKKFGLSPSNLQETISAGEILTIILKILHGNYKRV